ASADSPVFSFANWLTQSGIMTSIHPERISEIVPSKSNMTALAFAADAPARMVSITSALSHAYGQNLAPNEASSRGIIRIDLPAIRIFMNVAIIGTGYVGLTTGVCLGFLGHSVSCLDTDESKIDALKSGKIPIYEPN